MKTSLDCVPCFMRQALKGARLAAPGDMDIQERTVRAMAELLSVTDLSVPPPALAALFYRRISEITGTADPFLELKKIANAAALELLPELEQRLERDAAAGLDTLRIALGISLVGNYIDSGVPHDFPWQDALKSEVDGVHLEAYDLFREKVKAGAEVMILGDNAGEIVLDQLLVKELQKLGCSVVYVVRGKVVLNDAVLQDAEETGLTKLCEVVSSGTDAPGTVRERCNPEFVQRMDSAEVLISKGQGNYESLEGENMNIFFAFKAKCPVVAEKLAVSEGTSLFLYQNNRT